jgi:hypothetical protein
MTAQIEEPLTIWILENREWHRPAVVGDQRR